MDDREKRKGKEGREIEKEGRKGRGKGKNEKGREEKGRKRREKGGKKVSQFFSRRFGSHNKLSKTFFGKNMTFFPQRPKGKEKRGKREVIMKKEEKEVIYFLC